MFVDKKVKIVHNFLSVSLVFLGKTQLLNSIGSSKIVIPDDFAFPDQVFHPLDGFRQYYQFLYKHS